MEFNRQTAEKSEQIRWGTDDQAGVGQVISYTCAFCKRGFSNAQALGGHMNIHRRDRAKLKQQSSEENLLSLDISVKNSTDHEPQPQPQPQPPLEEKIWFKLDSGEDKINTNNHKKPEIFAEISNIDHPPQKGKTIGAAEIQLPFLAGSAAAGGNEMIRATSVMVVSNEDKRIMELSHACSSSSKVELDLELRLGPEPQEAPALSTREFF